MALQQVGTTVAMNPAVYDTDPNAVATASMAIPAVPVNYYQELEKKGFAGLKGDWRSEPMISLKDGAFESATGHNFGKEFVAFATGSRWKYAWQIPNGSAKTELAYTYTLPSADVPDNQVMTTRKDVNGVEISLAAFKASLGAKVDQLVRKDYYEVDVIISAPGTEMEGSEHILSISPASTATFAAHMKRLERFGMTYTHATRFKVGDKVKYGDKPAYYPWAFEIVT